MLFFFLAESGSETNVSGSNGSGFTTLEIIYGRACISNFTLLKGQIWFSKSGGIYIFLHLCYDDRKQYCGAEWSRIGRNSTGTSSGNHNLFLLLNIEKTDKRKINYLMFRTHVEKYPVFRIRIHIGSGFRGPLDPDWESGSRGLKKGQKCQIIAT